MTKWAGFMRRAQSRDLNVCPGDQGYTADAFLRVLAAAVVSTILVYTSPTVSPDAAWKGGVLLGTFFVLSLLASYGFLKKCEFRSGMFESSISFVVAFVAAVIFGIILGGYEAGDLLDPWFLLSCDVVVAWAVGGFFGSILSSVK